MIFNPILVNDGRRPRAIFGFILMVKHSKNIVGFMSNIINVVYYPGVISIISTV